MEGGIFWKKNQYITAINEEWRVEKIQEINKRGGWKCAWRVDFFFKINKRASRFIRDISKLKFEKKSHRYFLDVSKLLSLE